MNVSEILKDQFAMLEPALLKEIESAGNVLKLKKGEILVDYGQTIKAAPLLLSGSAQVMREDTKGNELFLYFVKGGEFCGLSLIYSLYRRPSQIKIIANENVQLIHIPAKKFSQWMEHYPSWKNFMFKSYSNRFLDLLEAIDRVAFTSINNRLQQYLQMKAAQSMTLFVKITHNEIARDLNTTRETISRELKKMESNGIIELGRNKIKILQKNGHL